MNPKATGALYYTHTPDFATLSIAFDDLAGIPTYKATREYLFNIVAAFLRKSGYAVTDGVDCIHVNLETAQPTTVFRVINILGESLGGYCYNFTLLDYERQVSGPDTSSERLRFQVSEGEARA